MLAPKQQQYETIVLRTLPRRGDQLQLLLLIHVIAHVQKSWTVVLTCTPALMAVEFLVDNPIVILADVITSI